jgi:hypothetical protein
MDYAAIARDGTWFAHRYDPEHDAVHFVRLSRDAHRAATFVTDDYLSAGLEKLILSRADIIAAAPQPSPVHFIFHSAFCCSTVLARAFDIPGVSMGLKEPPIYNDIVGWRHRGGGPPAHVAQVLDQTTTLLARPLGAGEATIIKPSNLANGLARGLLAMRRESKALLLYAPLETYLKSIAKKAMDGRLWVRDLLVKLLKEGLVDLGFTTEDYLGQTDLQVAAVGWLAQQALFARLAGEYPERVRTLDSEALLAQPTDVMRALAVLYGLALDDVQIDAIVAGPAFTTHSKSNAAFGSTARTAEYDAAAAQHGDEIAKVLVWTEAVAKSAGVAMTLPARLIA